MKPEGLTTTKNASEKWRGEERKIRSKGDCDDRRHTSTTLTPFSCSQVQGPKLVSKKEE